MKLNPLFALVLAAVLPLLHAQPVPQLTPAAARPHPPQPPASLAYPVKPPAAPALAAVAAPAAKPAPTHQVAASAPSAAPAVTAQANTPAEAPSHARAPRVVRAKPRAVAVATPTAAPAEVMQLNLRFEGDAMDAMAELRSRVPQLIVLAPSGKIVPAPVTLDLKSASPVDALRAIGEQAGDVANVVYSAEKNTVRLVYKAQRVAAEPAPVDPIAEAKRWQAGAAARPVLGPDGVLLYPFGMGQPELTCAPLRACIVHLQPGETINNVNIGDSVRWIAAPATSGSGATAVQQIVLKPWPQAEESNMIVSTNRRTYSFTLKRTEKDYLSQVGFYYPQDMVQTWNTEAQQAQRKVDEDTKRTVSELPITSIEQLNLDGYRIKGDRDLPWYPTRVFDDGTRVWVQMPASIRSSEAPALVLLDANGNSELVNYRVKKAEQGGAAVTYYIVDKLFERAGLILGVGRDQRKVEILRNDRRANTWAFRD